MSTLELISGLKSQTSKRSMAIFRAHKMSHSFVTFWVLILSSANDIKPMRAPRIRRFVEHFRDSVMTNAINAIWLVGIDLPGNGGRWFADSSASPVEFGGPIIVVQNRAPIAVVESLDRQESASATDAVTRMTWLEHHHHLSWGGKGRWSLMEMRRWGGDGGW